MLLFIEGYPYNPNTVVRGGKTVKDVLSDVVSIFNEKEEFYIPEYVGYCYSKKLDDVIFFLPKVVLTGEKDEENKADTIFGANPEDIIDFEADDLKTKLTEEGCRDYKEFLSNLSIWIYRTISVYRQTNEDSTILEPKEIQTASGGRKSKYNTLLDVIIALRDFNRKNQDYFTFIARNMHMGFNKIQWSKTVTKSQSVIQNGIPVYLDPVNKKKVVNFDEELLIIYFSILNYLQDKNGFSFDININYKLISPKVMESKYINKKFGCRRLHQIKYKYFSDKALRIWDLCYAFFDREYAISLKGKKEDYMLAKNFEHIFEIMIDTLIGDDKKALPKDLTDQKDGKMVDHMYIDQGLIERSDLPAELTYYIGDSKYYKRGEGDKVTLGTNSIYKQYTYARNVIQWNMNLFLGLPDMKKVDGQPLLRDDLTEGYNPIPNFFISAHIPVRDDKGGKLLSFDDDKLSKEKSVQLNRQFENRLFDRDTLLLCHYDVNFLYIVSLYGRDNKKRQEEWREKVRSEFRKNIQETLNKLYTFYTLQPRQGMDCYGYIKENFHQFNGKLYRPRAKSNYLIMALMKKEAEKLGKIFGKETLNEIAKNEELKNEIESHFHLSEFKLKDDQSIERIPDVGTLEKIEKEKPKDTLLGCIRSEEQRKWINESFSPKYNVRLMTPNSNRAGELAPTKELIMVKYLLLYDMFDGKTPTNFALYQVSDEGMIPSFYTYNDMKKARYPFEKNPSDDIRRRRYLVYEEINKVKLNEKADTANLLEYIKNKVNVQNPKGSPELVSYQAISGALYHT
jgi:hypothetical protein